MNRRRFMLDGAATAAGAVSGTYWPRRARAAPSQLLILSGTEFQLEIGPVPINVTGRAMTATGINGQIPAPILRWREGDTITLAVTNRLSEPSSIHWHGVRVPSPMDGVPGLSFHGIAPGDTYIYRFPVHQSGTYWYHSHSGFQEQTGVYGPIVIEPKGGYGQAFDRDYVVMLSDWSDTDPDTIVSNLKFQSDYYNFHQRTAGTFFEDVAQKGFAATVADRLEWGRMRMSPSDILDVSGATYTYLINGHSAGGELDRSVPAWRAGETAFHQWLVDEHLRCSHRRPADDRHSGRRQRYRTRHLRPVPHQRRRDLRRDRGAQGRPCLHDFCAGRGPHRLCPRHTRATAGHERPDPANGPAPAAHYERYGHGRHGPRRDARHAHGPRCDARHADGPRLDARHGIDPGSQKA